MKSAGFRTDFLSDDGEILRTNNTTRYPQYKTPVTQHDMLVIVCRSHGSQHSTYGFSGAVRLIWTTVLLEARVNFGNEMTVFPRKLVSMNLRV